MKKTLLLAMAACTALSIGAQNGKYIAKVYDYCPAPGQHINLVPEWDEGDTKATMLQKASEQLVGQGVDSEGMVSLGGFGGYVVFGFDHSVVNVSGECDFKVYGNAAKDAMYPDYYTSETGIVMVSVDVNGNGLPDDPWYELAGSDYSAASTLKNQAITYYKPAADRATDADPDPVNTYITDRTYIKWMLGDNEENIGYIMHNSFKTQSYWPNWVDDATVQFTGTLLASNVEDKSGNGTHYVATARGWGYVDDLPNSEVEGFDIDWAVDASGNKVKLSQIDFVKVYTGVNFYAGWVGEVSTEVIGAEDLHPEAKVEGIDYTDGVFVLNEGSKGFINFRDADGTIHYRVIEAENDNAVELGVTGQYATIWGDKVYVCSKQSGNGTKTSGRLMVFDAKTLKLQKNLATLANGGDPRAVLPTKKYVYVSTSDGIVVYDTELTESKATLCSGNEVGMMLEVGGKVFAVNYGGNIVVIDPETLTIEHTIEGTYYAMLMANDGNIWASTTGTSIVKINPYTYAAESKAVDYAVPNAGGAWTADSFFASAKENKIYWKEDAGWWGSPMKVYCYDIDTETTSMIIDNTGDKYEFYGAGMRMSPLDGNIYAAMEEAGWKPGCAMRVYSAEGEMLSDQELHSSVVIGGETLSLKYPYPALVFFPDKYAPEIHTDKIAATVVSTASAEYLLTDIVTDADNVDALIQVSATTTGSITAKVEGGKLIITGSDEGQGTLTITANSNGKEVSETINFTTTGIDGVAAAQTQVMAHDGMLLVATSQPAVVDVYSVDSRLVMSRRVEAGNTAIATSHLAAGVYVVRVGAYTAKVVVE